MEGAQVMGEVKFYKCEKCGDIFIKTFESGEADGAGHKFVELTANSVDAATEKHVPVIEIDGNTVTVTVGEVEHPMQDEHFITFIYLHTEKTGQYVRLQPGEAPKATFALADGDKVIEAFEYCNLHGLWVAKA